MHGEQKHRLLGRIGQTGHACMGGGLRVMHEWEEVIPDLQERSRMPDLSEEAMSDLQERSCHIMFVLDGTCMKRKPPYMLIYMHPCSCMTHIWLMHGILHPLISHAWLRHPCMVGWCVYMLPMLSSLTGYDPMHDPLHVTYVTYVYVIS